MDQQGWNQESYCKGCFYYWTQHLWLEPKGKAHLADAFGVLNQDDKFE